MHSSSSLRLVTAGQLGSATDLHSPGSTLRGAAGHAAVEEDAGQLTLSAASTLDVRASAITFAGSSSVR